MLSSLSLNHYLSIIITIGRLPIIITLGRLPIIITLGRLPIIITLGRLPIINDGPERSLQVGI